DDVLVEPEKGSLRKELALLSPAIHCCMLSYDYMVDKASGATVITQQRERLFRVERPWKWRWPVHETVTGPQGTVIEKLSGAYVKHLRDVGTAREVSQRNMKIITVARELYPDEPRFAFYFANQRMGDAEQAMQDGDNREL